MQLHADTRRHNKSQITNHFPSMLPSRPLLPATRGSVSTIYAPVRHNEMMSFACADEELGQWRFRASHSAGPASCTCVLSKCQSAMTYAVTSSYISIAGPCYVSVYNGATGVDGTFYAWSPNGWMAKLLVFAERAVNGQPSANPCVKILDRAMRTNLFS